MTISRLAAAGGVGVETVRYYQRRGLLPVPDKGDGIRRYGSEEVRQLRFIRSAQAAGFTLDQIGALLSLDATHERARARDLARRQIAALDVKIAELVKARESLESLVSECAREERGPCPILTPPLGGDTEPVRARSGRH